jgi:hypothetical protein
MPLHRPAPPLRRRLLNRARAQVFCRNAQSRQIKYLRNSQDGPYHSALIVQVNMADIESSSVLPAPEPPPSDSVATA